MKHITRSAIALCLPVLVSCADDPAGRPAAAPDVSVEVDADDGAALAAEGAALSALYAAPRQAPRPFDRLALRYDGLPGATLEARTSPDGQRFSPWRPLTVHFQTGDDPVAYVASLDCELAQTYELRPAGAVAPTFVVIETLRRGEAPPFVEFGAPAAATEAQPGATHPEVAALVPPAPEPPLVIGRAQVNPRSSWSAAAPRCHMALHTGEPYLLTVHHTDGPTEDRLAPERRVRQIQEFHQITRGWCDVGYQFLVSRDGRLWEGRRMVYIGAHASGHNDRNLGISYLGTYMVDLPNQRQLAAVAELMAGLADRYGGMALDREHIKGHREYGNTDCPGDRVFERLGQLARLARQKR